MKSLLISLFLIFAIHFGSYSQDLPNTIVLLSIPADKTEFKNIFQRDPTRYEMNNIQTLIKESENEKNIYFLKDEDDIDKIIETVRENYINGKREEAFPKVGFSLIGHNDKGTFYFPNGKFLTLEEVETKLGGFPAMFLSCNAKSSLPSSVAIDHKLTYNEALNIAADFNSILNTCNIYLQTPRQVAEEMINKLNQQHKIKHIAKFLVISGGMTGSFVLMKELDESQSEPQRDSTNTVN